MKKTSLFFILLLSSFVSNSQTDKKIIIFHTNDLHSRLTGFGPELTYTPLSVNDDKTVGGFARIASVLKNEKNSTPGTTLTVDAGDFLMGTLFAYLEPETGFQLRLMKAMGYDVTAIGNHEFDYGPEKLAQIIRIAASKGDIPALLLGNAVFDKNDKRDDALDKLFSDGVIKRKTIIERDGLKIGFFSLLGKVAVDNAAFAKPVKFSKQISAAKKIVSELRDEKCDIIICLSHSGVSLNKKGEWAGEDVELAGKVKGIDVIISGHTHTMLEKPIMVNGIPIVQAGEHGKYVGKLTLVYSNGKVTVEGYSLIPVDDRIAGDPVINNLIEDHKKNINEMILKPLGMDYERKVAETDFILECNEQGDFQNSNLGPMVADAIHSYINNHVDKKVDVSIVAVGVISDRVLPVFQSAPDIYRIMMMGTGKDNVPGYPLARVYITGKELKSVLEILRIAGNSTPSNYCYYSGIRVDYNPKKGLLNKINRIQLIRSDSTTEDVDFSKKNKRLYAVAANAYMLEFVGIIKKMSFGLINVVPKDISGNPVTDMGTAWIDMDDDKDGLQEGKEWLAIMEYILKMKDTNGNGIPDIDSRYVRPIQTFFPTE